MRILAVDTGSRRIGFAVNTFGDIAVPFATKEIKGIDKAVPAIIEAISEAEAEMVLIGLPINMDGTHGEMADKCRAIGDRVAEQSGLPVEYWDERLSTVEAERSLIEANVSRKKRKKSIDKLAAQVFLKDYLDSRGREPA